MTDLLVTNPLADNGLYTKDETMSEIVIERAIKSRNQLNGIEKDFRLHRNFDNIPRSVAAPYARIFCEELDAKPQPSGQLMWSR